MTPAKHPYFNGLLAERREMMQWWADFLDELATKT
jgi:hypothetical protein